MASAYERLLTDPKSGVPVGVPTFTPVDTRKTRVYATAVIECGGEGSTDEELRIQWNPHSGMANDVDVVRLVNASVVSGSVGLRSNSTFTASQFGSALRGRLVAARLDVSNISDAANGTYIACYDRSGGDIQSFNGQDIASRVNEKSSVTGAAGSEDVHLLYRPHSDDERTNWVSNVNEGPFEGIRTITSSTFPVAGVVTWRGNNAAGDDTVLANVQNTYYQGGSDYQLYNSGTSYTLYNSGTNYTLYDGTGGSFTGYTLGNPVQYVVRFPGTANTAFPAIYEYPWGTLSYNNTQKTIWKNEYFDDVFQVTNQTSGNTWSYYAQEPSACLWIALRECVWGNPMSYPWHYVVSRCNIPHSDWTYVAAIPGVQPGYWRYDFTAPVQATGFAAKYFNAIHFAQGDFNSGLPGYGTASIWYGFPFSSSPNFRAKFEMDAVYSGYISDGRSSITTQGHLVGSAISGIDRGNAVQGTNLGTQVNGTNQGTEVTGYNRGDSVDVGSATTTVHKSQRFLLTFCGVYEYCGETVNESDKTTTPAARGPVPLRAWRSTAYSTPRKVLDSAMKQTKTSKKRVIQDTPYGRY